MNISIYRNKNLERGQVLPLWVMAVVITLMLIFLSMNYGNQLRYQMRAQNAADSAANAVIGIQTSRWNNLMTQLYASAVEEYRIRRLLDGLFLTINQSGGCISQTAVGQNATSTNFGYCGYAYGKLRIPYLRAVSRYTADVQRIVDITTSMSSSGWKSDAAAFLQHLASKCNLQSETVGLEKADGGDCTFAYSFAPNGISYRTGLGAVQMDALSILIPSLGASSKTVGLDSEAPNIWAPGQVDIVTCALVPPIIPNIGPYHFQPTYAVGRSAATSIIVDQDWIQPGYLNDPARSYSLAFFNKYQPLEDYVDQPPNHVFDTTSCSAVNTTTCVQSANDAQSYYNVDFGGNTASINTTYQLFQSPIIGPEFSARMAWWGGLPIPSFGGPPILNSTTCK